MVSVVVYNILWAKATHNGDDAPQIRFCRYFLKTLISGLTFFFCLHDYQHGSVVEIGLQCQTAVSGYNLEVIPSYYMSIISVILRLFQFFQPEFLRKASQPQINDAAKIECFIIIKFVI
jgi:hypothetical protein